MILGRAGVGKTSLKRSLMRLKWEQNTKITGISDISCVRPFANEWYTTKHGQTLKEVTPNDEKEELLQILSSINSSSASVQSATSLYSSINMPKTISEYQDHEDTLINSNRFLSEIENYPKPVDQDSKCQSFFHMWDCGGQLPFLEILPVFLTSRTMFLLTFDASKSLHDQEVANISTIHHMKNWMINIHGYLMKYTKDGKIFDYPRMYCIGTHGDHFTEEDEKQKVIQELRDHYIGQVGDLVEGTLVVDNTSSGENEDPSISKLRNAIIEFTEKKLVVKTPASWVLFRNEILKQYDNKNVISIEEAIKVGKYCKISKEDVPKVLLFYHDLGAVLYYHRIPELQNKVIIRPKYFVDTLSKLFTFDEEQRDSFKLKKEKEMFQKHGILVQPLYQEVWEDCNTMCPQDLVELLVHFRLAAEIHIHRHLFSISYSFEKFKCYFIPANLKIFHDKEIPDTGLRPTPLHITFTTGYVPPGFFTRFVTVVTMSHSMELVIDKVYRNCVTFRYNGYNDFVYITDHVNVIQVDIIRHDLNIPNSFNSLCNQLLVLLKKSAQEVEELLSNCCGMLLEKDYKSVPGEHSFHFLCAHCQSHDNCYLLPTENQTTSTSILCTSNQLTPRKLHDKEKYWFEQQVFMC